MTRGVWPSATCLSFLIDENEIFLYYDVDVIKLENIERHVTKVTHLLITVTFEITL